MAVARRHAADDRPRDIAVVKRIHYRWTDLFGLVLDLERFPDFVPHCRAVKVYSRTVTDDGRTIIVSRMTVGVAGIHVSYANRTTGDHAARRIEVKALDGPLRRLDVLWTFEPDGEDWTRVGFSVDYAFNSAILAALASRAFDAMFRQILIAFERRAQRLFGRSAPGKPALVASALDNSLRRSREGRGPRPEAMNERDGSKSGVR